MSKPKADASSGTAKKHRLQIDFPPAAMARLNALKEKTEAASYVEVVKNAMRLYEALLDEAAQKNEFLLRAPDGSTRPYRWYL